MSVHAQSAGDMVIPRPQNVTYGAGYVTVPPCVRIEDGFGMESGVRDYISERLDSEYGISDSDTSCFTIFVKRSEGLPKEGYNIVFTPISMILSSSSEAGVFYGFQTLFQMLSSCREYGYPEYTFNCQVIDDSPRFPWRAYMLDEARHFMGKETVKNLLDEMARLKMNVFHWHLTDDAGWRVEIRKYPKLTEIGSHRSDTQIGGWNSDMTAGKPHSGYYRQEDIKEILEYARIRQIKIVPEIEMPGHASAAIAAYPWLGITKEKIEVPVRFGKHYCAYDVIDPRVKRFLHDVIIEVAELFETDVVHIGGDEVRFDQWEADRDLREYKEKKGFNSYMDIQIEFTNGIADFAGENGIKIMGWNEILGKNLHAYDNISFAETSTSVSDNVIVHFWLGDSEEIIKAAVSGNKIVNSTNVYTYIDYNYETIPLEKAYEFDPVPSGLPEEYVGNILGLGCQMWTEWASRPQDVYIGTFPRIAAYAEDGWTDTGRKDYDNFLMRLKLLVPIWQRCGLNVFMTEEMM